MDIERITKVSQYWFYFFFVPHKYIANAYKQQTKKKVVTEKWTKLKGTAHRFMLTNADGKKVSIHLSYISKIAHFNCICGLKV